MTRLGSLVNGKVDCRRNQHTADGRCHLTAANLVTMPHRSHEWPGTLAQLRLAFADTRHFAVHAPVPPPFGDEGAANHMRLCSEHGAPGVEVFVSVVRDAELGPVALLRPGGVLVELAGSTATTVLTGPRPGWAAALAPSVVGRLLAGYRGSARCDVDELFDLVDALLAVVGADAGIAGVECNPVIVHHRSATVVDLATLELAGTVGTHEVSLLSPGQPVQVFIEGQADAVTGRVDRIAPAAEAGTRAIGVVVVIDNRKERYRAGQYAQGRVELPDETPRLQVPLASVAQSSGQDYVWSVEQGALVRQKLAEAEREIAQAMQLADQAQFATLQGYILVGQGRKGEAQGAFQRALGLYPGYQPAQRALTRLAG